MQNRNLLTARLLQKFSKDLDTVLSHFNTDDKIVITETIIKKAELYNHPTIDYEAINSLEDEMLKKYRHKLKPYVNAQFHVFFDPIHSLVEKDVITTEEFNTSDPQGLTDSEFNNFLNNLIRYLFVVKQQLYLEDDKQAEETAIEGTKTSEYTTSRQVLAVHYLLEYAQVRNIDRTEIARFIHFLTGKPYTKLDNSNIYKKVKNPLGKASRELNSDLRYIRNHFDKLGMTEVVKMINNDLLKIMD